jgi:SET domain-containing protein
MNGCVRGLVEVRPSAIHGLGVFAAADIPSGTVWWTADVSEMITVSRLQFEALIGSAKSPASDALIAGIQEYSFYVEDLDLMILIPDDGRYVNHSDAPNSVATVAGRTLASVAVRDIAAGEEIVEDYETYDFCPWPGVVPEFHAPNVSATA